jgi:hypothetical protein
VKLSRSTIALTTAGVAVGASGTLLLHSPSLDVRLTLPLLSAALGFLAGMIADRFRVEIWARQESWKLRREMYTDVLFSLAEMKTISKELVGPVPVTPDRLAVLMAEHRGAQRALGKAIAVAAVVDPATYEAVKSTAESSVIVNDDVLREMVAEKAAFDGRFLALEVERKILDERIVPLKEKFIRSNAGIEPMTPAEMDAFDRILQEQRANVDKHGVVNKEFHAHVERTGVLTRERTAKSLEMYGKLQERVIAAARAGGLEP